jgi:endoglucanase
MKSYLLMLITASCIFVSCKKSIKTDDDAPNAIENNQSQKRNSFLHAYGNRIEDGNGNNFFLKGAAFGNDVWQKPDDHSTHHAEIDYKRVKDMGMNVVRFYMTYKTFEDDSNPYSYKQSGWDWIDQNIAWAKNNGIYLILNMHIPQGGFQSIGGGNALWTNIENQNRLVALWKTIANRYKGEEQIAGFGLLNEPQPLNAVEPWRALAQRITDSIRTINFKHILFVEKALNIQGLQNENTNYNFPIINDYNVVYEFHVYDPTFYAFQLIDYTSFPDGGKYPDDNNLNVENTEWYTGIFNNPAAPSGTSNWQLFEGVKYKVGDVNIKLGIPVLAGSNVGGRIYFDDIIVKEFNEAGIFVRDVYVSDLNSKYDWGYWSSNNSGIWDLSNNTGVGDNSCLYIEGNTADCNLGNYKKPFLAKQNYSYQISGWMKGDNVSTSSACKIRIDFLNTSSPIYGTNKAFLDALIGKYVTWGNTKNVPMYIGEVGISKYCFENNKGGLQYMNDLLDIMKAKNVSFTYHNYHGDDFSIYFGGSTLPTSSNVNQQLIDIFTQKLN